MDDLTTVETVHMGEYEVQQRVDREAQPNLAVCSTKALCEELRKRHGVEGEWIEPYKSKTIIVSGPMSLLFISD